MTIKNRLSISNFLMIVIPAVLALVVLFFGITALWVPLVQQNNIGVQDLEDFETNSTFMLTQIEGKILETSQRGQNPKISDVATSLRTLTGYTVQVKDPSGEIWTWGIDPDDETNTLREVADTLNRTGIISAGQRAVSVRNITTEQGLYRAYIYGYELNTMHWPAKNTVKYTLIFIFVCIIAIILVANRFLTRFTFNPIKSALTTLSEGVKQIKEGNLNVTLQYERNDEFKPVCEDFNDMARRLKASVDLVQKQENNRKELMASISHDLRSPLTSIKAYAEGLADNVASTPEMRAKYANMILTKSNELEHMISELFAFSKMDLDEYPYHPETVELGSFLQEFYTSEKDSYAEKGLVIELGAVEQQAPVWVDRFQLCRIMMNILDNSVKYKVQDKGHAVVSCHAVPGKSAFQLQIVDDGPGVSEEALPRLFDVFYRSDAARRQPQKGSGLGLAIVQKLVQRMEGEVTASLVEPQGLAITITLPCFDEGDSK